MIDRYRPGDEVLAEQRTMAELAGHEPAPKSPEAAADLVDAVLDGARTHLQESE